MNRNQFRLTGLLCLLSLAIASLACNLPTKAIQGAPNTGQAPSDTQPGSDSAGQIVTPAGERVAITLTEGQLNAVLQQAVQTDPNSSIGALQLALQPGEVALSGAVNQEGLILPLELNLALSPDGQGGLSSQVTSATVGPFPLPQSMRDQIENRLNQGLHEPVRQMTNNMFIEEITIGDGVLNLVGRTQ